MRLIPKEDILQSIGSGFTRRSFLCSVGGAAGLVVLPAATGSAQSVRSFTFSQRHVSTGWLPFDFYRESQIHLRGRVANADATIFLDSGVSGLILHKGFAEKLGIRPGRALQAKTVSSRVQGWEAPPQTITFSNLSIRTKRVLVLDLSAVHSSSGRSFDVMLGRDLFEQFEVDVDFANHRFAVHHPDHYEAPAGARSVSLAPRGSLRSLPVSLLGRRPVQATFDTGSNTALIVSKAYAEREQLLENLRKTTSLSGGAEGVRISTAAILPRVNFGGVTFTDVPATIPEGWSSGSVDANVGVDLLSRFRMITDYPRNRLLLLPYEGSATKQFRRNRSGLRPLPSGDRLVVKHVSRGSPAEAAGWRVGEEIVSVNGWRVGSPEFTDERSHWASGPAGTTVRLTMADGTERILTLADYY